MRKKNGYHQGIFNPKNKSKCTSKFCAYRSLLELKYMRWLDENANIISWGSETIILPYIKPTDGKLHRYFIDFNFTIRDRIGKLHKFIVEVKPKRQCVPPKAHGNKKASTLIYEQVTWAVNSAKWSSAEQWAKKNGYKFTIVTEDQIKALK